MGQGQSKEASPEPLVFVNPNVPIYMGENLRKKLEGQEGRPRGFLEGGDLNELDKQAPVTSAPVPGNDGQLEAWVEELVQQRVAQALRQAQAVTSRVDDEASSESVMKKADGLISEQKAIRKPPPPVDPKSAAAEQALIQCFRQNPHQSLNCWKQVDQFRNALKKVQSDFIELSSRL